MRQSSFTDNIQTSHDWHCDASPTGVPAINPESAVSSHGNTIYPRGTIMSKLSFVLSSMVVGAIALGLPTPASAAALSDGSDPDQASTSLQEMTNIYPTNHLSMLFATSSNQDPPHRGDDRRQ
jgi:hypothetical protein